MKTHVLVLGSTSTEKERIRIRQVQHKLEESGAKTVCCLDLCNEGQDEPNAHQYERLLNAVAYGGVRSVVYTSENPFIHNRMKEVCKESGVQCIASRDIVFTGSNPFPFTFLEKVEQRISSFFQNGAKSIKQAF